MFDKEDCSYESYRNLLTDIKSTGRYCDYSDVVKDGRDAYLILRHDIEFSIDRAYGLARVEAEEGIASSYFVQITNNAYNAFSKKNVEMLRDMHRSGHHIGLHYHRSSAEGPDELKADILRQSRILSEMLDIHVDRFSFHRPTREHLAADIQIDGLINAYGNRFFVLTDDPSDNLAVKYIADSNHQWKYLGGATLSRQLLLRFDRIQLLIHPLSWSAQGANHLNNFQLIVQEKHDELIRTIEEEWKLFDLLRGKL